MNCPLVLFLTSPSTFLIHSQPQLPCLPRIPHSISAAHCYCSLLTPLLLRLSSSANETLPIHLLPRIHSFFLRVLILSDTRLWFKYLGTRVYSTAVHLENDERRKWTGARERKVLTHTVRVQRPLLKDMMREWGVFTVRLQNLRCFDRIELRIMTKLVLLNSSVLSSSLKREVLLFPMKRILAALHRP